MNFWQHLMNISFIITSATLRHNWFLQTYSLLECIQSIPKFSDSLSHNFSHFSKYWWPFQLASSSFLGLWCRTPSSSTSFSSRSSPSRGVKGEEIFLKIFEFQLSVLSFVSLYRALQNFVDENDFESSTMKNDGATICKWENWASRSACTKIRSACT